eukprot:2060665-Pyramimonas_sp.AAC.1
MILDRMRTEDVNDAGAPNLTATLDSIDKEDVPVKEWATRFNAHAPMSRGEGGNKRRRTTKD